MSEAGGYEILWSEEANSLALYCPECRERVCDVEHDDTLSALVAVAEAHECGRGDRTFSTSDILNAYDAFDGDDVGEFTEAWDDYLAGNGEPCSQSADGLHQITHGSCDQCGRKNFS